MPQFVSPEKKLPTGSKILVNDGGEVRVARLLLSSYACSPSQGSEHSVGWNRALQAARFCETWVLCDDHSRSEIEDWLDRHGTVPGLTFHFLSRLSWEPKVFKLPGGYHWYYKRWQRRAFVAAQRLHAAVDFDLVHHVNYVGYREPGYLWQLGLPFVWGPIGGTQNYPTPFLLQADLRGAIQEAFRALMNPLQLRYSRRVHKAARAATTILAANSTNQRDFERIFQRPAQLMLETGIPALDLPKQDATDQLSRPSSASEQINSHAVPRQIKLLWSGGFRTWKALQLLIRALAEVPSTIDVRVRVLGSGPLGASWKRLADRLDVAHRIEWLGWLPHARALDQFRWADAVAFTSLRDTSGNVVLEGFARGVPTICLDHQGVHDIVTQDCGIKVAVIRPVQVVRDLAKAIAKLAMDPVELDRLRKGAIERAKCYLWQTQGERMADVYREALRNAGRLPL